MYFLLYLQVSKKAKLTPLQKDAVRFHDMLQRCEEEQAVLADEVKRVLANLMKVYTHSLSIAKKSPLTQHDRGLRAMCVSTTATTIVRLVKFAKLFPQYEEHISALPGACCGQVSDEDVNDLIDLAVSDDESETEDL